MNEKITRRQLAGVAAASLTAGLLDVEQAVAQVPDFDSAARESHKQNSDALAKFDIPMSLEPAFQFKA
jgi:hypothetical protein